MKLRCPLLLKPLATIVQENYQSFYPSEPFRISHFTMRHPVNMIFFDDFIDFTNWAWYRQGLGKYEPEDIDPSICTHVVYAFAVLDESKLLIKPSDTIVDRAFYQKITALKSRGVKVTIGLGGWSDSHNGLV